MIYFDNATIELPSEPVQLFVQRQVKHSFGATSSVHSYGQAAKGELEKNRLLLANIFNANPQGIFFCSGRTEANNIAVGSIMRQNPTSIITSPNEPASILKKLQLLAKQQNIPIFYAKIDADSGVNLPHIKEVINNNPNSFISLSHVNQFTGRLLSISRIVAYAHKNNCIFHSDISHSAGKFIIDLQNIKIDIITAGAEFFGGISGSGFVITTKPNLLSPMLIGKSCEYGISAGNENILALSTMVFALQNLFSHQKENLDYVSELKFFLKEELIKNYIDFETCSFEENHFSPYFSFFSIKKPINYKNLIVKLDLFDTYLSYFQCDFLLKDYLQISFCKNNSQTEITKFVAILKKFI